MIEKFCKSLTEKIRTKMPEIDDERAEVIYFGLRVIIGEVPKVFIMLWVAWVLGIFEWALFTFIVFLPYKGFVGGVHLKTDIACLGMTILFYLGIPFVSKFFVLPGITKYIVIAILWVWGIIMIKLYAPADTENVPILDEKVRKKKKILSYITFSIGLIATIFINNSTIVNIMILGSFIQTILITKIAYRLTNNKYGYEVYGNTSAQSV